ncbi:DNA methyltransferase [Parvimonas sp. KA00067]|uniref:site-specific DNA-methyltransferase n=1 Tax=Parvimonas sp. KA00067 TaxID=1588755 RepID=UPI0008396AA1|nr:DNA methyltransferase [Parvimonas sp. KA00067]
MQIEKIKIENLKEYGNNAKIHTEEQINQICESIKRFGNNDPIAIDENNIIIEGHGRLYALKKLGYKEVEVIRLSHLNEQQKKAYILAHNKLTMNTDFDLDKLKLELLDITEFDMSEFGFEDFEMEDGIEETEEQLEEVLSSIDENKKVDIQLGDMFRLGNHILMCGDSYNKVEVLKLINNKKIDLLLTDPPYNLNYSGGGCFEKSTKKVKERIKDIIDFDVENLRYIKHFDIGSFYFFTSKDSIKDYLNLFSEYKFNILTWNKNNVIPMVNNNFLPDTEYILYFYKDKRIWNNGLKPIDIYKKYYISSIQSGKVSAGGNLHPTIKPLELIKNKILISSNEDSIVLDLFGGSGTTLIACEELNRQCFMMEYDPTYVDVIIKRWENLTGEKAIKLN